MSRTRSQVKIQVVTGLIGATRSCESSREKGIRCKNSIAVSSSFFLGFCHPLAMLNAVGMQNSTNGSAASLWKLQIELDQKCLRNFLRKLDAARWCSTGSSDCEQR